MCWIALGLVVLAFTPLPDRAGQALLRWTHRRTNRPDRTFRVTIEEKPYGRGEWLDVQANTMNSAIAEAFKQRTSTKTRSGRGAS